MKQALGIMALGYQGIASSHPTEYNSWPSGEPMLAQDLDARLTQVRKARPFLKWAGGKGQLLDSFSPYFPADFGTYFEPFLGSGAVFFHLRPPRAVLSDAVEGLIETYAVVRDNPDELIASLKSHRNEKTYYYQVRALDPEKLAPIERASRFIYLNRTCYNGLYRVNREGKFNVPFGKYKNPRICDEEGLRAVSEALRGAELKVGDFEEVLEQARSGDFIYLDPPYHPVSRTASFTSYFKDGFGLEEQKRLASVFRRLDKRGCLLMLSNSHTDMVQGLYAEFRLVVVEARRAINSKGDGRGPIPEYVILNYEP